MTVAWRISREKLLDKVEHERVSKTMALLKLQDAAVIDSYSMSPNGPTLASVFVVNGDYFLEISMAGKHLEFDVASATQLVNYRVTFGELDQPAEAPAVSGEASPTSGAAPAMAAESLKITKFVKVGLRHTDALYSELSYFGNDADDWLNYVLGVLPPIK